MSQKIKKVLQKSKVLDYSLHYSLEHHDANQFTIVILKLENIQGYNIPWL